MNAVYRHRLFTHEDIFITKFPVELDAPAPNTTGTGGGREGSNNKTDANAGGKNKSKAIHGTPANMNAVPSQLTVLATPDNLSDISDHKHTLSATVGGVELKYTVTYVRSHLIGLSVHTSRNRPFADSYLRILWACGMMRSGDMMYGYGIKDHSLSAQH